MSDAKIFRVVDSGVLEGRLNIALGQAIVEAHHAGEAPDTLRFLRFPPTALIGRHQALAEEVNLDYCRENGIGLARRITGGGAIFLDSGQLGWELALHRDTLAVGALADVARELCEAVADGISRLGVDARYRPRNDIEVDGRKISGTGGFFDGGTLFYQGTVLVDMDAQEMASALRVPQAKLARRELDSAARRVVTLRELLGERTPSLPAIQQSLLAALSERLGFIMRPGELSDAERLRADEIFREEVGSDEFVAEIGVPPSARGDLRGSHSGPGGTITSYLRLEGPAQNRVRAALITGDFFITPPRVVYDLESRLRGVYLDDLASTVRAFFDDSPVEALSVRPEDFLASLENAVHEP
ncbi:MAG: lipoate--protein ligase family protein [Xanthomonadales bacterium]|nr:lipoate--protein ligase family protein [Xanthomonadales bacterium]